MLLMVGVAPRVIARFGPKIPMVTGMLLLAAGMLSLARVDAGGHFATSILPATLIAATGMALAFIPSLGTAISAARPEEGGLAARHRQHLLPDRLRPRPSDHDRRRERPRCR